jgi:hypothetical protein
MRRGLKTNCRQLENIKSLKLIPGPSFIFNSWSQRTDLNRRPTVYETVALPLSYAGMSNLRQIQAVNLGSTR